MTPKQMATVLTVEQRLELLELKANRMQKSLDIAIELSLAIGLGLGLSEKIELLSKQWATLKREIP